MESPSGGDLPTKKRKAVDTRGRAKPVKRPLSAYNIFFSHQKELLKEEQKKKSGRNDLFQSMAKTIGQRWKTLSPEEYKRYTDLADADSARYQEEMNAQVLQTGYFSVEKEAASDGKATKKKKKQSASASAPAVDQRPSQPATTTDGLGNHSQSSTEVPGNHLAQIDGSTNARIDRAAASNSLAPIAWSLYPHPNLSLAPSSGSPFLPYTLIHPSSLLLAQQQQQALLRPIGWNQQPLAWFPPPAAAAPFITPTLNSLAVSYAVQQRQPLDPSSLLRGTHGAPPMDHDEPSEQAHAKDSDNRGA